MRSPSSSTARPLIAVHAAALAATAALLFGCSSNAPPAQPAPEPASPGALVVAEVGPADGSKDVAFDAVVEAAFTKPIDPATLSLESFTISPSIAVTVSLDDGTSLIATLRPDAPLPPRTTFTATLTTALRSTDGGALEAAKVWSFTTRDPPLVDVVSVEPADGANAVALDAKLRVTFDAAIDPTTLTASTFLIVGEPAGAIGWDAPSNTATLTPAWPLINAKLYVARLTQGVLDLDRRPIASAHLWTFTTVPDTLSPHLRATSPAEGASGVDPTTPILATFDEPLDPETITSASFTVDVLGGLVMGEVRYDATTRTARFTPASPLPFDAPVFAHLSSAITDLAGNPIAPFDWTFTVAADDVPPLVVGFFPAAGATGISPLASITARFSEPLRADSVDANALSISPITAGTVTYDAATFTVAFTPADPLPFGATLTAIVGPAVKDLAGNAVSMPPSWSFTVDVDRVPPIVIATEPARGATLVRSTTALSATFSKPLDPATVTAAATFTVDGGVTGTVTYSPATRTAVFTPASPLPFSTTLTASLTTGIADANGNPLAAPVSWSFATEPDTYPPHVAQTTPASNATGVLVGSSVLVRFDEPMDPASLTSATFTVGSLTGSVAYDAATRTASFLPSTLMPWNTRLTATVAASVTDAAGNPLGTSFSFSFTVERDTYPPHVASTAPAAGAVDVSADTTAISATFDEPMLASTITGSSFTISGGGVTGTVGYDAATRTATFTPTPGALLPSGATLTATLAATVKDAAGNPLGTDFSWSFTVAADTVAPTIVSTDPASGATGIVPTATVKAVFSEAMKATTITASSFTLTGGPGGAAIAGTVSYAPATRTATFTPTTPLPFNAQLTASLTAAITDLASNPIAATTWQFQTQIDNTPPTILSVVPANNTAYLAPTAMTVQARFSEPMDPSSLTTATFTVKEYATPVPGTVSYNAATKTATFTLSRQWTASSYCTATVTTGATDLAGNGLAVDYVWTFSTDYDHYKPTVASSVPAANATGVASNTAVAITFSEPLDPNYIEFSSFSFNVLPANTYVDFTFAYDAPTRTATLTPTSRLMPSTSYRVTTSTISWLCIRDLVGNLLDAYTLNFTTAADTTPPSVASVLPLSGMIGVDLAAPIRITFDEAARATSVTTSTITVSPPVSFTVQSDSSSVYTLVHAPLQSNTLYTVTVGAGIADLYGNATTTPYSWSFRTLRDTTPPALVGFSPADGARAAPLDTQPKLVFSEMMDLTSLAAAATLSSASSPSTTTPFTVTMDAATRTAALVPTSPLQPGTDYTVQVTTAATDLAGNGLTAPASFSFRTTGAPTRIATLGKATPGSYAVVYDDAGAGIATWELASNAASPRAYWSKWTPATSTWSAEQAVPAAATVSNPIARSPRIATNGTTFMLAWIGADASGDAIFASEYASGSWSTPTRLMAADATSTLTLVASRSRYAVASYTGTSLRYAFRDSNGWDYPDTTPTGSGQMYALAAADDRFLLVYRSNSVKYLLYCYTATDTSYYWSSVSSCPPSLSYGEYQDLALYGKGQQIAAVYSTRTTASSPSTESLKARIFANGVFGVEQQLSSGYDAFNIKFAASATSLAALWSEQVTSTTVRESAAIYGASGGWSTTATVAAAHTSGSTASASLASDGTGFLAAWSDGTDAYSSAYVASWATTAASLGAAAVAPVLIGGAGEYSALAAKDSGTNTLITARSWSGTSWGTETTLDTLPSGFAPVLASGVNTLGYAAFWTRPGTLRSSAYGLTGWGAAATLQQTLRAAPIIAPRVARTGATAVAAWIENEAGIKVPYAAVESGGAWGSPQRLTPAGAATTVQVETNGTDFAVLTRDGAAVKVTSYSPSAGAWSTAAVDLLAGSPAVVPSAVRLASGRGTFEALILGTNGTLWETNSADGATWTALASLATGVTAMEIAGTSTGYLAAYHRLSDYKAVAVRETSAGWGTPTVLDYASSGTALHIATNGTKALVTFDDSGSTRSRAYDGSAWATQAWMGSVGAVQVAAYGTGFVATTLSTFPNPSGTGSYDNVKIWRLSGTTGTADAAEPAARPSCVGYMIAATSTGAALAIRSEADGAVHSITALSVRDDGRANTGPIESGTGDVSNLFLGSSAGATFDAAWVQANAAGDANELWVAEGL